MSIKLQSQMNQVVEAEREIHVKGFHKNTDEKALTNFFAAGFGKVESVDILKDAEGQAVIRFQKHESVTTASQSSNKVFLHGSKLTITARRPSPTDKAGNRTSPQNTKKATASNDNKGSSPSTAASDAVAGLSLVGDFDNQLGMLCQQVLLNQHEHGKLLLVGRVLEDVIQDTFPGCRVLCFGSAVSGLALKGSDLDCFVQLPENLKRQVCLGRSSEDAQRFLVNRTRKRLYSFHHMFGNIVSIPNARIPIVKFIHKPSGHSCDVSFKNLFGISNTFLIKFLLNTDPRLLPLFTFIKYWAKHHNIIGNGKMTSYSLTMLIIFYLQQLEKPMIPPLIFLQRDRSFDIYEEGWNCGFDLTFETFPSTQNDLSLSTLVLGFFHYYSEFNFKTHVVCTLTGNSIEKSKFLSNTSQLPDEMENYIYNLNNGYVEKFTSNKPMCVQDPIVLSTNTTRGVTIQLVKLFQSHCDLAIDNISTSLDNNTAGSLISTLLNQKAPEEKGRVCKQTFNIKIPDTILTKFGGKVSGAPVANLITNLSKVVLDIFKNILHCKSQGNVNIPPMPRTNASVYICYQCAVVYNVWDPRKDIDVSSIEGESFMDHQSLISAKIIEGIEKPEEQGDALFHFGMNLKLSDAGNSFVLRIKSKTCPASIFSGFVNFFHVTLKSAVHHHLDLSSE